MKVFKIALIVAFAFTVTSCDKTANTATDTTDAVVVDGTDGLDAATPIVADATVDPSIAAKMDFESDTYDFGTVQAGEKVERTVEFTNNGKSPLLIKNAKASCGCTVPEYEKEPVAPGEKGFVKIAFTAPKTNGKQTKTVTLTTNTAQGTERFKIQADVVGGTEKQIKPNVQPQVQSLPAPKLESPN